MMTELIFLGDTFKYSSQLYTCYIAKKKHVLFKRLRFALIHKCIHNHKYISLYLYKHFLTFLHIIITYL